MPNQRDHAKQVKAYDDTYLTCRDLRHVWQLVGYYRSPGGIVRRLLDCQRCGTQRADRWRPNGEREASSYSYADAYQIESGFDTYEVRKEVMSRATIYQSEAAMIAALTDAGTPRVRRNAG